MAPHAQAVALMVLASALITCTGTAGTQGHKDIESPGAARTALRSSPSRAFTRLAS